MLEYKSVRLFESLPRVQSVACLRRVCLQREGEKDRDKSSKLGSLLTVPEVKQKGGREAQDQYYDNAFKLRGCKSDNKRAGSLPCGVHPHHPHYSYYYPTPLMYDLDILFDKSHCCKGIWLS